MVVQVTHHPLEDRRGRFNLPNERVARTAEQATYPPRLVAVIHDEHPIPTVAEAASPALRLPHRLHLRLGEPVLRHEGSPAVFGPSGLRVLSPPLPKALVSSSLVGLAVLPVPVTHTRAALASLSAPVGERFGRLVDGADTTDHLLSIVVMHGIDQPCHADVLLELANAEDKS